MIAKEKYTLSNGVKIPKIGLGTWFIPDGEVAQAVQQAVAFGYRHIDTAQAYQNEKGVGEGIKSCGVERKELFITTKIAAEIKSFDAAQASIDASLKRMGLDYLDLVLIHSPKPWKDFHGTDPFFKGNVEVWRALEEAYDAGKIKAIGVSNFQIPDLENILNNCKHKPMVNQVLAHISNTPQALIAFAKEKEILIEAYSPIGHGELMKNNEIAKMAEKYRVTIPQLAIRYCLELGLLPLPKTANPAHMKNNIDVDFTIEANDLEILLHLEKITDYGKSSMFPVFKLAG